MEKLGDTATHGIDPRDIRPLGRIAVIARMGEVRLVRLPEVLDGNDVITLKGQLGQRLGEPAVLATPGTTLAHEPSSHSIRSAHAAFRALRERRARDFSNSKKRPT